MQVYWSLTGIPCLSQYAVRCWGVHNRRTKASNNRYQGRLTYQTSMSWNSPEDLDMGLKKGENILPCLPLVSSSSAVGKSPGSEFVPGPSCSAENMK